MRSKNLQSGQSLIETIVAIYILTIALVAGVGLAIFAAGNQDRSKKEIIATNLAREGVEVVRMFRDTNWLQADDTPATDDDLTGCNYPDASIHNCYPKTFTSPYDLRSGLARTGNELDWFILNFDNTQPTNFQQLDKTQNGRKTFLICLQNDGSYSHKDPAFPANECPKSKATYARRIVITDTVTSPYTGISNDPQGSGTSPVWGGHSPMKRVTSTVVWTGKGCLPFPNNVVTFDPTDRVGFPTPCIVTISEYLTNWKDYK